MLDARFSQLYFCPSLNTLQLGLPAIADLVVQKLCEDLASGQYSAMEYMAATQCHYYIVCGVDPLLQLRPECYDFLHWNR